MASIILVFVMFAIIGGCILVQSNTYNNFRNNFFTGDEEAAAPTIKIGVYEPLSGAYKQYGREEARGIELANKLYPTVLGKNVELIYVDNRSNMYDADTALQELMSKYPSVVLGSYGEVLSLVAADYMVAYSTPAITITGTNPLITANNDFYFTASFSASQQGTALAKYAVNALNRETFATVRAVRDDSSNDIIDRFNSSLEKLTNLTENHKGNFVIDGEGEDFSACIGQLKNAGADTVFLCVPPAVGITFMSQCLTNEYTPLFLGTREWDTEDMEKFLSSNPDISASYTAVEVADITDENQVFVDAYNNNYGLDSEPTGSAAAGFDAYLIALKAIEDAYHNVENADISEMEANAGADAKSRAEVQAYQTTLETGIPSGTQIRDAMLEISDFNGATGVLSYDGSFDVNKTVTIIHFFKGEKLAPYSLD